MPPSKDARPPLANVLGVGISAIDMTGALRLSDGLLQDRGKGYICVTGVHGVMESQRDAALRDILNRSFLCLPDGMPTVWVGRLQGHRTMGRVYGPDFMLQLCKLSARHGHRHFLYGGKRGVAEKLSTRLEILVPGIDIVGTYTPPFRPLTFREEADVIARINKCRPDVVWVGLSTPKQERFMAQYIERFDTRVMVGVGAAFDIHAGLLSDAPQWVKECGLQWLDRLCQEPRRLWRRYLSNNPRFLWDIALQFSGLKRFEEH
jgi:N-acetylglucosaminyldiphosphoundecaprenol N-acetyl-beta-D-mannosaminyltransferase